MSAYLAMIHNSRANWLGKVNRVGGDYTAYGLVSDGLRSQFFFLDKRLAVVIPLFFVFLLFSCLQTWQIHSSPMLGIGDLLKILQYFRHIFTAIANHPSTRSNGLHGGARTPSVRLSSDLDGCSGWVCECTNE